ncbi:hypothetical protein [Neptuniibacter sp. QD37_11]|uniref:hypothetical protein n=1 Tax=Neptuniibacter sp. QD37_11 TaxID=3398209 RepID=UPI0039F591F4
MSKLLISSVYSAAEQDERPHTFVAELTLGMIERIKHLSDVVKQEELSHLAMPFNGGFWSQLIEDECNATEEFPNALATELESGEMRVECPVLIVGCTGTFKFRTTPKFMSSMYDVFTQSFKIEDLDKPDVLIDLS